MATWYTHTVVVHAIATCIYYTYSLVIILSVSSCYYNYYTMLACVLVLPDDVLFTVGTCVSKELHIM